MSARGKSTEVLAVVLSDILFFLIESNQKYHFFSQDGKSSVVSLSKLLVREKDGMRDSRGFYLICSSDDPEMYELVCKSPEERCHWIAQLKDAIVKCCHEDSGRHELSAQDSIYLNKSSSLEIQQLLDLVQEKDSMISSAYKERTEVILEVLQMIAKNDYSSMNHKIEDKKLFNSSCLISAILQLENRLLVAVKQINAIAGQQEADFGSLSNGVLVTTLPKKRADTFSGFEYRDKESAKNLTERRQNVSEDHCRQQSQNESLSSGKLQHDLRNHRRGSLIIATDQTESHRTNSNGADKSNRRMSVNLIPNVLNKLHRDKESTRTTAGSTGKSDEGSTSSVPQVSPLRIEWLSTLVTDECESLAQLALHIHSLLDFLSDQSSEMQNLRLELNRMNQNVTKLYEENDRLLADRKLSGHHHDKQLEELRSLQGSMERQKKELVKLRENHEAEMQKERHELEKKQSDIEKQKAELNLQKELLKQEKDFLQRQCDLFEEQRIDVLRLRHNSNDSVRSNPCSSFHDLNSATTRSPKCAESQDKVSEIPNRGNFVTGPSNNPKDLKLGLERYRNLFTKDSGAGSKPHRMSSTVQQILPMKLSTGSSPSTGGRLPHLCSKPDKTHGGMSKNFSEGSIGEGVDHLQSSSSSSSLPFYSALYASRSQPQINFSISAIPSHMKTNVMLPIHLTEKSKSTPVSAHGSPARYLGSCVDFPRAQNSAEKQTEKPPALKESDIIFF